MARNKKRRIHNIRRALILSALALLLILMIVLVGKLLRWGFRQITGDNAEVSVEASVSESENLEAEVLPSEPVEEEPVAYEETKLKSVVNAVINTYEGDWSVYFAQPETGAYMVINDQQMATASVIKLYVMGAVLEAIETGAMENSQEIESLLESMITVSDNDAWTSLTEMLGDGDYHTGMERVTSYARANGYTDTEVKRDLNPYNYSSVKDTGLFLQRVLEGTNVSEQASKKMLTLLMAQEVTRKIPAGVPEGVITANKTGELDTIQNDAAIVFAPTGTYILVIFTDGGAVSDIRDLSSIICAYVDPE